MGPISDRARSSRSLTALTSADSSTDEPLAVADDGLFTPEIKPHSLEKIRAHNRYARIFTTAMRAKWKQLAYIGLYSGAGRAKIAGTSTIVETSALSVLRQPIPFDKYIFVDNGDNCVDALRHRCRTVAPYADISILARDVNESAPAIRSALPRYGPDNGLLSFCFVDPFDTTLKFSTIRALSGHRIDFLILLMTAQDARRNFRIYFADPASTRIADLLDCPGWRDEFRSVGKPLTFMLRKFNEAMERLGYLASKETMPVYAHGKKVLLYNLAFYSQHEAGRKLWGKTISSLARLKDQTQLFES
jgi:three-Cys-motif partner protein